MGFLDKVKNMFIEEYDDDEIKKEVIQVKIPTPERKKEVREEPDYEPKAKYDDDYEKVTLEEQMEAVERKEIEEKEVHKNTVPKFFDDRDFEMLEEKRDPEILKQDYKYGKTETTVKPNITGYGSKKEETKKSFTPTPIISPVYGVLDKNYKKEEISAKKRPTTIYTQFDKIDVDDIRRKAYGTLEDELEKALVRDAIIFNDSIDTKFEDDKEITEYEEQPLDIFKELEKKDALDDLLESYNIKNDDYIDEEDDMSLVEEELNKNYDNFENDVNNSYCNELNDSDLFNLIDSMYSKGENE